MELQKVSLYAKDYEVLQQAAEQYAEAVIAALPAPEECNHKFSKQFEEKMQSLINDVGTNCFSIAIHDPIISK